MSRDIVHTCVWSWFTVVVSLGRVVFGHGSYARAYLAPRCSTATSPVSQPMATNGRMAPGPGRSDPHQRRADLRVRQHHTGTYARAAARRRRCWGAGWALVGDAGYFKDP